MSELSESSHCPLFLLLCIFLDLGVRQRADDDGIEEVHDDKENTDHVDDDQ